MATNAVIAPTKTRSWVCSDPTTPASGAPVIRGNQAGVALTAERSDGTTTVALDGVFELSVKGVDSSGNSAVAVGDRIYYQSGDTPKLSKKATDGIFIGYAAGAVDSAATATIPVEIGY